MARTAISPPFNVAAPDHGGNPWIPAVQTHTAHGGWNGEYGIDFEVMPGTEVVQQDLSTTWVYNRAFPDLWGQQSIPGGGTLKPALKPHLSAIWNWFSAIAHRGATEYGGYDTFQDRGYLAGTPQPIDSPGLMDPIPAGRGISRSRWNSDAIPAFPALVPLVRTPAPVSSKNRRGGRGYVMPNPLARIMYPLYVEQNMGGR